MPHSLAYSSARSWVRLATATRATFGDSFAPGITFRLMSAVETIPHRTGSANTPVLSLVDQRCVLSRNDRDRCGDARIRVHGQGALERVPEDRVHDVAAAARAKARRHRRPERGGSAQRGRALRLRLR